MYNVDDLVVYPTQGVGKILRIDTQKVGGIACDLYIVRIQSSNITLMVPVRNAESVGLRPLVDAAQASEILETLKAGSSAPVFVGQNWNRRFREYSDKLKNPDLHVVASVLQELLALGAEKELSYGERRLQEQAMGLVCGEIAEVLKLDEASLREEVSAAYAPAPVQEDPQEA